MININFVKNIGDGHKFILPNSVDILSDNIIVVADGGNNKIYLLNSEGKVIKKIGTFGYNKYKFKEPVGAFVSPEEKIYVMDWHNHRIVIFDKNLNFLNEFGHFGDLNDNNLIRIIKFFKRLANKGSYIKTHFNNNENNKVKLIKKNRLLIFLDSFKYWVKKNNNILTSLIEIYNKETMINKPNGIAFIKDKIYLSQKNNKCISVLSDNKIINNIFSIVDQKKFGRIGNITSGLNDELYICDERNSLIYICDIKFDLIDIIKFPKSDKDYFFPFSCDVINEELLVVCGGVKFLIISLKTKKIIYCSKNLGELHGVAYNKEMEQIYVANRSEGLIHEFKLTLDI